ncbi:protein GRIP-like isoform X3 [Castanea sativa]|uniref:protein GRIP-like isoform X3 n=1 Tax=Castanea sativa TaxID=21020 RepID=UPI003F64BEB0
MTYLKIFILELLEQEAMLKSELHNMERVQKREGVDMTYLKNVILKLLETGEVDALLPVIGMLLQFCLEEAMMVA